LRYPRITVIIAALVLALFASIGGAVAAGTIGSKDITDNSVKSKDIRDRTIKSEDLSGKLNKAIAESCNVYLWTLVTDYGVAAIPTSAFYAEPRRAPSALARFCFAKQDDTIISAADRLARLPRVD
jgi:hypothetical protein